ncbi:TPA: YggU family protein [Thermoplasmata archaeon]|nr:YggU family protein [Thermoplasmata archaeon]
MVRSSEFVREVTGGSLIQIIVSPGAKSTEAKGVDAWRGALQVRVAAEPRDGEANAELVKYLSEKLSVPHGDIRIVKGSKSHGKSVFVPLTPGDVRSRLGVK